MIYNIYPEENGVVSQRGFGGAVFTDVYEKTKDKVDLFGSEMTLPWIRIFDGKDYSHPNPVFFAFMTDIKEKNRDFKIHYFKADEPENEKVRNVGGMTSVYLCNLEIGKRYGWYIVNEREGFEGRSEVTYFETADEFPRVIQISDNVLNVRDIGGVRNIDGKMIRQGLVFRGGCLDGENTPDEKGIIALRDDMMIKSDIDMRGMDFDEAPEIHPNLRDIKHYMFAAGSYGGAVENKEQMEVTKEIIALLADRENLPAYVHCHSGTDRTGTIIFILGLLLRMDTELLYSQYEYSCFGEHWEGRSRLQLKRDVADVIMRFGAPGDDIYTCTEKYFEKAFGMPGIGEKLRDIYCE